MKRHVSTSTGLIILFAFAVIVFGGAYTYANLCIAKTTIRLSSAFFGAKADPTKNWNAFEIKNLGLSFKYPNDWGTASIDNGKVKVETGYSYNVSFSKNKDISMGYTSTDMVAGREGTFYEMININKNVAKINNCSTYKQYIGSDYITSCKDVLSNKKTIGAITVLEYPADSMVPGSFTVGYYFTSNATFPIIGLSLNNKLATTTETFEMVLKSFTHTSTVSTNNNTNAATATVSDDSAWKAYRNDTYGFGLTFTDAWKGYKIKEVDLQGTVKTFYINVPTTDSFYATGSSTANGGYAAPFAIGIISKSVWDGSDEQSRDYGSKIGEDGNYVFTYSQWQACPSDLCNSDIVNSMKTVKDSFQVL